MIVQFFTHFGNQFCSSMLRFRFCSRPHEFCPLCGKQWLWEHFFACRRLDVAPVGEFGVDVYRVVSGHVERREWDIFLSYVRFYLLQWHDLVHDPIISCEDLDNLIV